MFYINYFNLKEYYYGIAEKKNFIRKKKNKNIY